MVEAEAGSAALGEEATTSSVVRLLITDHEYDVDDKFQFLSYLDGIVFSVK